MNPKNPKICIVGLGYVGLPLAIEFAKAGHEVVGFDHNQGKVDKLLAGQDPTSEVGNQAVANSGIVFTSDQAAISQADFIIVAVPTPIDEQMKPDLGPVKGATEIIGRNLQAGSIVVYESTVYPGVTEEVCIPILEKNSGLKAGKDFKVGYSPERINPGDRDHWIDTVVKVVSAQDNESLNQIAQVYETICKAGVHRAPTIKVAEATKITENIQRDLNIALMNELAKVFDKMDIDTQAVIDSASTKWNFHKYYPGLVGGHCIGVDPYYFLLKAKDLGVDPEMTIASRHVNESMAGFLSQKFMANLKNPQSSKVLVLGLTFKEDITDYRNSKAKDVISSLQQAGVKVVAHDPMLLGEDLEEYFGVVNTAWEEIENLDGIIFLVGHKQLRQKTLDDLLAKSNKNPVLFDLRRIYDKMEAEKKGFKYLSF